MALARRQALLAQMSAPPASPKRKRESAVSGGEEMDLPEALEALLAVFGQIEAISERFTSRGAVPTVDAVAEGAQLKRDVVLQVAAAVPELYRVERRASDAQLVLLRLPPAVASIDHSLPAWRQQEACLLSRRLAFRAALRAHWQSTGTAQLPAFTVPALPAGPRPAPAAATLPAKAAAKTQTKPAKALARPAPALVAPADSTAVPDELKGLSLELIGRVRGREAERAQRRPLAASHEEEVVAALPRLADALRSLFAATGAAKVASLPTSQLLLQLQTALAPQSKDAICEQVIALARIIPAWATLVSVAQESGEPVEYLRLDRTMPFPEVKRRLAESLQTVQNATNSEGERMKTKGT